MLTTVWEPRCNDSANREEAISSFPYGDSSPAGLSASRITIWAFFTDLDFDEALRELQTARRLLPDRPEIPFKLGVLLINHGRYSEACANFAEALRLRPDSDEVRQYLRFCEEKRRKSETR